MLYLVIISRTICCGMIMDKNVHYNIAVLDKFVQNYWLKEM